MKSIEELKNDAKVFFGARVIENEGRMQIWHASNGKLLTDELCSLEYGDEAKKELISKWLHNAIDDSVRRGFNLILPAFEGKKWRLSLDDYTAELTYNFPEDDAWRKRMKINTDFSFPMTPEILLELTDFLQIYDGELSPLSAFEFFPHLAAWR